LRFLIHQHKSSSGRLKYYLRLEKDGVFKGWAIPKGMPKEWKTRHLAIQVGDLKLNKFDSEGKVERGKFGPGIITILDRGEYRIRSWGDDKIIFDLFGPRVKGSFALVLFPKAGPLHWLLGQTHGESVAPLPAQKSAVVSKKPERTTLVHQIKPRSEYSKPTRRKPTRKRKAKVRFLKQKKSSYRTGYTSEDWLFFLAFIIGGAILLVVLVALFY
jgi:DNA ligase D-like protein (predicted 3'-phosphoesterase)